MPNCPAITVDSSIVFLDQRNHLPRESCDDALATEALQVYFIATRMGDSAKKPFRDTAALKAHVRD